MEKLTAKSNIKPVLAGILFTPSKMTVTDSFRLLEVEKKTGAKKNVVLKVPGFTGRDNVQVIMGGNPPLVVDGKRTIVATEVDEIFPEYERVFPTGTPAYEMKVNPKLLGELLIEMSKHMTRPTDGVLLQFFKDTAALNISGTSMRALMMPMSK